MADLSKLPDMPERWAFYPDELEMWLEEDGYYVEWHDYAALRAYTIRQQHYKLETVLSKLEDELRALEAKP